LHDYANIQKELHKSQFTYSQKEDLVTLKSLLSQQGPSLSTDKAANGQIVQD
jgi:hypothetical protein